MNFTEGWCGVIFNFFHPLEVLPDDEEVKIVMMLSTQYRKEMKTMPKKKIVPEVQLPAKKTMLADIKATCEASQYCHQCKYRTFCTMLRVIKPRFWKNDSIEAVERIAND